MEVSINLTPLVVSELGRLVVWDPWLQDNTPIISSFGGGEGWGWKRTETLRCFQIQFRQQGGIKIYLCNCSCCSNGSNAVL